MVSQIFCMFFINSLKHKKILALGNSGNSFIKGKRQYLVVKVILLVVLCQASHVVILIVLFLDLPIKDSSRGVVIV